MNVGISRERILDVLDLLHGTHMGASAMKNMAKRYVISRVTTPVPSCYFLFLGQIFRHIFNNPHPSTLHLQNKSYSGNKRTHRLFLTMMVDKKFTGSSSVQIASTSSLKTSPRLLRH